MKMPSLKRMFIILFIAELAAFAIISALPIHDMALYNSFSSTDKSITSQSFFPMWLNIFPHNLLIATIEFIPVFGILMFAFSIGTTATVVAVEGTAEHVNGFAIFATLMLLPHSWLELPSYAVAASTSIYIIYLLAKGKMRQNYKTVIYMYIFVVIELAFAGLIETSEILLEESAHPFNAFYMWLPAIPIIAFLIYLYRKMEPKKEEEIEQKDEFDFNQF